VPDRPLDTDHPGHLRVVNLKVPRLRKATLETVIIERYRRRESSIEEALIQMYLAGVSRPQRPPADASEEVGEGFIPTT
jgi:hypothetical protein